MKLSLFHIYYIAVQFVSPANKNRTFAGWLCRNLSTVQQLFHGKPQLLKKNKKKRQKKKKCITLCSAGPFVAFLTDFNIYEQQPSLQVFFYPQAALYIPLPAVTACHTTR